MPALPWTGRGPLGGWVRLRGGAASGAAGSTACCAAPREGSASGFVSERFSFENSSRRKGSSFLFFLNLHVLLGRIRSSIKRLGDWGFFSLGAHKLTVSIHAVDEELGALLSFICLHS